MLTFQQIISTLVSFWDEQGCVIQQGHDLEVGAGTFNPATFLRCLGPEPFCTVYVEPSRRPQDGRFGENPNRTQLFHQLQVIVKPSPRDIQATYLQSLEAVGFNLKDHDVRFIHDDWESPSLGAWGLGWEVWLDGMEITQFTYFQSIAGISLSPVSVELTYGLERLCMIMQGQTSFFTMQYSKNLTYGEIYHRSEVEWSHYNFSRATPEMWLRHFEDFEGEAQKMVKLDLPIPAYDFVLKASHAFNMLEARHIFSVTERTTYIARIRALAKLIAERYLESRKAIGFPLLKPPQESPSPLPSSTVSELFHLQHKEDFLLEIGSEELPATFVPIGCQNLKKAMIELLSGFSYDSLTLFGTPRRLSVLVRGLSHGAKATTIQKKGPAIYLAFNTQGKMTKQGKGFVQSLGIDNFPTVAEVKDHETLYIKNIKGRDYLMAESKKAERLILHSLSHSLPQLIANLNFPKKMRWDGIETSYARPLRWFVALLGSQVVPFTLAGVASGRTSRGHAQLDNHSFEIDHASTYTSQCLENHVMVGVEERRRSIERQLGHIEMETSSTAIQRERVLSQVLFLSEWPMLTYAPFDSHFLRAPKELLISEMVHHQKYFPLITSHGNLAPLFVITADNIPNETIRRGNQQVLSARLTDGIFLFEQDLKTPLDDFAKKLEKVIFQKELGTMAEKVFRIKRLSSTLSHILQLGEERVIARGAELCKADLATALVHEFPDLQGTIGKYYALHQKEDERVALAIEEHWRPRYEKDALPSSSAAIILSLADKLDNLISYFRVGLSPTSSNDPYALRRQTIGILKILIENSLGLELTLLIEDRAVLEFVTARAKWVLSEEYGFLGDEIEASLQGLCTNPYDQYLKVEALHTFRKSPHFYNLFEAYKRTKGQIEKEGQQHPIKPHLFKEPAEKKLYETISSLQASFKDLLSQHNYREAFEHLATLHAPLSTLFEEVKILSEEVHLRSNRIALLQEVFSYFSILLDFGKIQHP